MRKKKSETLDIRLTHEDKQAFVQMCQNKGMSASEVLRAHISKDLNHHRAKKMQFGAMTMSIVSTGLAAVALLGLHLEVTNYFPQTDAITQTDPPNDDVPRPVSRDRRISENRQSGSRNLDNRDQSDRVISENRSQSQDRESDRANSERSRSPGRDTMPELERGEDQRSYRRDLLSQRERNQSELDRLENQQSLTRDQSDRVSSLERDNMRIDHILYYLD